MIAIDDVAVSDLEQARGRLHEGRSGFRGVHSLDRLPRESSSRRFLRLAPVRARWWSASRVAGAGWATFPVMRIVRNSNGTFAPGNVSNPAGANQWTRRREVEQLWLRLLDEVNVEQGRSRIELILDRLIQEAEAGRSWAIGMVLDRILPPIRRGEIEVSVAPREISIEAIDEMNSAEATAAYMQAASGLLEVEDCDVVDGDSRD